MINPNEIKTDKRQDNLTEKAFSHSLMVSVFSILMCLIALCSVTWAWFSGDVASDQNTIKTGDCTVIVTVTDGGVAVDPNAGTDGIYTFEAGKTYNIHISASGTVKSSYCKFIIGTKTYITDQVSTSAPGNEIEFSLTFTEETSVQIVTCWGTYRLDTRDFYHDGEYTDPTPVNT